MCQDSNGSIQHQTTLPVIHSNSIQARFLCFHPQLSSGTLSKQVYYSS
uniref:Uncharacterized protein n=1 Tax=Arundo donax TaxID=35708 RepID=A0A0A8YZC1_ARUDO